MLVQYDHGDARLRRLQREPGVIDLKVLKAVRFALSLIAQEFEISQ